MGDTGSGREGEWASLSSPILPFCRSPSLPFSLSPVLPFSSTPASRSIHRTAAVTDIWLVSSMLWSVMVTANASARTFAAAGRAGPAGHVALQLASDVIGCGFPITALQVGDHALVTGLEAAVVTLVVDITNHDGVTLFAAIQDDVHLVFAEFADGHVERDVVVLADRLHHGVVDRLAYRDPTA